ncbi:MAG: hypothetical protein V1722_05390 [Candidatus Micrarchaeota archaeon]
MARFSKARAREAFQWATHGIVRLASAAAFRAKMWKARLQDFEATPLHELTDAPVQEELVMQNELVANVLGRHLSEKKRTELLDKFNRSTRVTSSRRAFHFMRGSLYLTAAVPLIAAGAYTGHPLLLITGSVLSSMALVQGIIARHSAKMFDPSLIEKSEVDDKSTMALRVKGQRWRANGAKLRLRDEYILSNAIAALHSAGPNIKIMPGEKWQSLDAPTRGAVLGISLSHLHQVSNVSERHAWSILNLVHRGKLTPDQAYEMTCRRYMRLQKRSQRKTQARMKQHIAELALVNFKPKREDLS